MIAACEKPREPAGVQIHPEPAALEKPAEAKKEIRIVRMNPAAGPQTQREYKKKYQKGHTDPYRMFPCKGPGGRKWRIGCIEGGAYDNYYQMLLHTAQGLKALGWIDFEHLPAFTDGKDTRMIWVSFLSSARVQSQYIEFVRDAFYSAGWDTQKRKIIKDQLIHRFSHKRDIDLVFAMGTWAGKDMANDEHCVPTVCLSVSDPIRSGIIPDPEDSGYDHLHARVDPTRYRRQVELFYNAVHFRRLGIQYKDTPAGRSYAAIEDILDLAWEKGFEVVACELPEYIASDTPYTDAHATECMEALSLHADAVYITSNVEFSARNAKNFLRPLTEKKIPTFAQSSHDLVRYGALMGTVQNWEELGRFHAQTIGRILNGAKPRDLPQLFEYKDKIAINLKTAEEIGFQPDDELLSQTDMVFTAIRE